MTRWVGPIPTVEITPGEYRPLSSADDDMWPAGDGDGDGYGPWVDGSGGRWLRAAEGWYYAAQDAFDRRAISVAHAPECKGLTPAEARYVRLWIEQRAVAGIDDVLYLLTYGRSRGSRTAARGARHMVEWLYQHGPANKMSESRRYFVRAHAHRIAAGDLVELES